MRAITHLPDFGIGFRMLYVEAVFAKSNFNSITLLASLCLLLAAILRPQMPQDRRPIPIILCVVCLSACHVVYCGQTMQDRSMVCIEDK